VDATQHHITIYNISPTQAEDLSFDFDIQGKDFLTELVPDMKEWGDVGWMDMESWEYDEKRQQIYILLETSHLAPKGWLKALSRDIAYFQNKLATMISISKDETKSCGVAVMDGEILQDKILAEIDHQRVGEHYDELRPEYTIEQLDDLLWRPAGKFLDVCEKFYLAGETENENTGS